MALGQRQQISRTTQTGHARRMEKPVLPAITNHPPLVNNGMCMCVLERERERDWDVREATETEKRLGGRDFFWRWLLGFVWSFWQHPFHPWKEGKGESISHFRVGAPQGSHLASLRCASGIRGPRRKASLRQWTTLLSLELPPADSLSCWIVNICCLPPQLNLEKSFRQPWFYIPCLCTRPST